MEYIKNILNNTYDIIITDVIKDENEITHIYGKDRNNIFYFLIICPHSGNDYKYGLRYNAIKTMDRWSVCDIEEWYKTDKDLIKNFDIDRMKDKLLEYYIDLAVEESEYYD